jgi:hypothetical protein
MTYRCTKYDGLIMAVVRMDASEDATKERRILHDGQSDI